MIGSRQPESDAFQSIVHFSIVTIVAVYNVYNLLQNSVNQTIPSLRECDFRLRKQYAVFFAVYIGTLYCMY